MIDASSRDYFEQRAEQELAASEAAGDARAAQSHRELAERYRSLANGRAKPQAEESAEREPGTMTKDFLIFP